MLLTKAKIRQNSSAPGGAFFGGVVFFGLLAVLLFGGWTGGDPAGQLRDYPESVLDAALPSDWRGTTDFDPVRSWRNGAKNPVRRSSWLKDRPDPVAAFPAPLPLPAATAGVERRAAFNFVPTVWNYAQPARAGPTFRKKFDFAG